jgi:signal transduction histidine kinase
MGSGVALLVVAAVVGGVSVLLLAVLVRALAIGRSERDARERMEKLNDEVRRAYADRDAALEASRTGVALFSAGKVRFWNHALVDLLGLAGDGGAMDWRSFVARFDGAVVVGESTTLQRGERHLRLQVQELHGGELLVTVDDVTAEQIERDNRDRFVAEIVQAREEEARSIAELLHDDALQELSALALRLELDALRTGNENLVDFARDANAISRSIRRLVVDLHPAVLESRGLGPAIDMAAQSLREAGIEVEVDALPLRVEPQLERLSYRLVQEAFGNVLVHAGATHVRVLLALLHGRLHCEVRDNGRGIDPNAPRKGQHGLDLARKRLELAAGTLTLSNTANGGTSFAFELPVTLRARELEATA